MLAASLNGALGRAGLMLTLAAATFGAIGDDLRHPPRRPAHPPAWPRRTPGSASAARSLAVVMMQRALITRDFSLAYVQQVGSHTTPALYNIAAMWSALEGSILLWVVILAGFTAAVGWRFRRRTDDPLVGWALVVMFVVMAFFALLSFGPADPFADGRPDRRRARARTRCCRTTCSCCSTRRSSTSATSGSPCRSPSPSPPSSPGGSARAG